MSRTNSQGRSPLPADRARLTALLLTALLASCAPPAPLPPTAILPGQPVACQVGPDGAAVPSEPGRQAADRGIDGSGATAGPGQLVDRGIGGTAPRAGAQV